MTLEKPDDYGSPSVVTLGKKYGVANITSSSVDINAMQDRWRSSVISLSGSAASFDSDNLLTNEWSTAHPLDILWSGEGPAQGCYVGLGAFQNFSYAAALNVAQAVIMDVRPTNIAYLVFMIDLLQQCASPDEFIANLFCRPDCRPHSAPWTETPSATEVEAYLQELSRTPLNKAFMKKQVDRVSALLVALINNQVSKFLNTGWAVNYARFCIENYARFDVDLTYISWGYRDK